MHYTALDDGFQMARLDDISTAHVRRSLGTIVQPLLRDSQDHGESFCNDNALEFD